MGLTYISAGGSWPGMLMKPILAEQQPAGALSVSRSSSKMLLYSVAGRDVTKLTLLSADRAAIDTVAFAATVISGGITSRVPTCWVPRSAPNIPSSQKCPPGTLNVDG